MLLKNKKNLKIVGIIHARGGSKRIPLKNIKLLAGKPLIAHMIESALKSRRLNKVIVSTDHDEIARISREYGAEVPFKRPVELAEDVPSELVSQHAVDYLIKNENYYPDIAVTMQPTTPFCSPEDIDACIDKLIETDADSVITVREVRERPEWMYRLEGDRTVSLTGILIQGEIGVTQSLQKLYTPNGAVYATKMRVLKEQNLIIGRDNRAVVMPPERSIDIDEPIDFVLAEIMAKELGYGL
ncbi:MAG: acylneuraminate cytidylyltransferase family protein [Candidatus Methanoperedens sp.]|nr:acylneuraminate cytidylyltransferase family protein [Candidatus Methanoperedens sp.]